jgi:hypothetical protein
LKPPSLSMSPSFVTSNGENAAILARSLVTQVSAMAASILRTAPVDAVGFESTGNQDGKKGAGRLRAAVECHVKRGVEADASAASTDRNHRASR